MATKKKMLQAAAGSAGGAGLDIDDVFSTYLYRGTGSTQTITNGNDLDGEGGLVWIKSRSSSSDHFLFDTERGPQKRLITNATLGEYDLSSSGGLSAFNADGFNIGSYAGINSNAVDFASWTFRKAPKFFDVVTWTGNGQSTQTIPHNLGSAPGFITIKATGLTQSWWSYHRSLGTGKYLKLDTTGAAVSGSIVTATSDSDFTVGSTTTSTGQTYVAYLFAHNDGDGDFGDGSQDIIKCGGVTATGGAFTVDLGFEPQWVLLKKETGSGDWILLDNMRGVTADGVGSFLVTNSGSSTQTSASDTFFFDSTGLRMDNFSAGGYIYMAIRRGPLAVPEDATEVFATSYGQSTKPWFQTNGWPVDMAIEKPPASGNGSISSRLTQDKHLYTNGTDSEFSTPNFDFDFQNGFYNLAYASNTYAGYMWRRAPNFFDVVAYSGDGVAGRTISHNLGVAPEMILLKGRNYTTDWAAYHVGLGNTKYLIPNTTAAAALGSFWWNNTSPTENNFTLGPSSRVNNSSSNTYIAYLFASAPGVSKVGSYTGNGSSQTINCGFTSGARFILIKRTDSTGDWYFWSNLGGIVSGNSPHQSLNTNSAPVTTNDSIDPASSGFIVNQVSATNINVSSAEYIFYAIA